MNNQFVDILSQFLNTHVFIEFRIFTIQRRQHVFHTQVQIERTFEVSQSTQQAQCFGLIDTDAEQEQQVIRTGFLNNDAMFVEVFRHDAGRNTKVAHGAVFFHPRSQQGDFDRVKIHVLVIDVFEAVPGAVRTQRPAFSRIDMIRLPYIKEPAIRFRSQTFDLFTEFDRTFNGTIDQTFTCIAFHHRRSGFSGRHDTVVRRGGGVHHVGFVKGFFVVSFYSQFQQTRNIFQPLFHLVEGVDNGFEGGTLFTQRLCAFGFVPDIRLFQLGVYFFQTLFLGVVVKDTP